MNYDENGPDYSLDHGHDEDDRHGEEAAYRAASSTPASQGDGWDYAAEIGQAYGREMERKRRGELPLTQYDPSFWN